MSDLDTSTFDSGDTGDDFALTADEQAAFEAMDKGEPDAGGPADDPGAEGAEPGSTGPKTPEEITADEAAAKAADDAKAAEEAKKADEVETNAVKARDAERGKRKEAERREREANVKVAQVEERLRLLTEMIAGAGPKPPGPGAKDPAAMTMAEIRELAKTDIIGAQEAMAAKLEAIENGQVKSAEERQTERLHVAVATGARADVARFAAAEPSYMDAYGFLQSSRIAELKAAGFTEAQARQSFAEDEFNLTHDALRKGNSPAEIAFAMAKARGWTPKAPEPTAQEKAAAASVATAAKAADAAKKLEGARAGQAANKSLSSASGLPADAMTAEKLSAMPEAEFEAWMEKNPAAFARIMKGEVAS